MVSEGGGVGVRVWGCRVKVLGWRVRVWGCEGVEMVSEGGV